MVLVINLKPLHFLILAKTGEGNVFDDLLVRKKRLFRP